jgi:hypothetical protein
LKTTTTSKAGRRKFVGSKEESLRCGRLIQNCWDYIVFLLFMGIPKWMLTVLKEIVQASFYLTVVKPE